MKSAKIFLLSIIYRQSYNGFGLTRMYYYYTMAHDYISKYTVS